MFGIGPAQLVCLVPGARSMVSPCPGVRAASGAARAGPPLSTGGRRRDRAPARPPPPAEPHQLLPPPAGYTAMAAGACSLAGSRRNSSGRPGPTSSAATARRGAGRPRPRRRCAARVPPATGRPVRQNRLCGTTRLYRRATPGRRRRGTSSAPRIRLYDDHSKKVSKFPSRSSDRRSSSVGRKTLPLGRVSHAFARRSALLRGGRGRRAGVAVVDVSSTAAADRRTRRASGLRRVPSPASGQRIRLAQRT